jgi:ornithine cyclodeaminase
MRVLNAAAVREALPMEAAIAAMEAAFGDDTEAPERVQLGVSLFMPGRVGQHTGVKVVSTAPGDPAGIVAVFAASGHVLGLADGPALTSIRTGAGCGLATRLLAPEDASTLAMLGAGAMAADQVAAVRAVRPIERVIIWSRSRQRAERLAEELGAEVAETADEAVAQADVVSTATPALEPLFTAAAAADVAHLNAVGAFTPEMAEIPSDVVRAAFVVVDDRAAAAAEAGDLLQAGKEPDATVGDLLAGRATPSGRPTFFKSVGIAAQDVAAGVAAVQRAEAKGLGRLL